MPLTFSSVCPMALCIPDLLWSNTLMRIGKSRSPLHTMLSSSMAACQTGSKLFLMSSPRTTLSQINPPACHLATESKDWIGSAEHTLHVLELGSLPSEAQHARSLGLANGGK
jgi:hypothetical protein